MKPSGHKNLEKIRTLGEYLTRYGQGSGFHTRTGYPTLVLTTPSLQVLKPGVQNNILQKNSCSIA